MSRAALIVIALLMMAVPSMATATKWRPPRTTGPLAIPALEAHRRLTRILGETSEYRKKEGRVAYQVGNRHIMTILNAAFWPKSNYHPGIRIVFDEVGDGEGQDLTGKEFTLRWSTDALNETVEMAETPHMVQITTGRGAITFHLDGSGDFLQGLRSVELALPDGWEHTFAREPLELGAPNPWSGAIPISRAASRR